MYEADKERFYILLNIRRAEDIKRHASMTVHIKLGKMREHTVCSITAKLICKDSRRLPEQQ